MGKKRLVTSIVLGASVGAIVSLFNKGTRDYVKDQAQKSLDQASFYAKNPTLGINQVKKGVESLNQFVNTNADNALNTLEQIDSSLGKFLK